MTQKHQTRYQKLKIKKKIVKKTKDENIVQKLKELKEMLDSGTITEEEFIKAKKITKLNFISTHSRPNDLVD